MLLGKRLVKNMVQNLGINIRGLILSILVVRAILALILTKYFRVNNAYLKT